MKKRKIYVSFLLSVFFFYLSLYFINFLMVNQFMVESIETAEADSDVNMKQNENCINQLSIIKSREKQVNKLTSDKKSIIQETKIMQKQTQQLQEKLYQTKVDNTCKMCRFESQIIVMVL